MLNLTAADLALLTEALTIAESKLRYTGPTFGAEYDRSLAMARLREQIEATPVPTTIDA